MMAIMNKLRVSIAFVMLAALPACSVTDPIMDSTQQYFQRTDAVTLSAGNAQAVNSRLQEIDPWPPYVGNNAISGNGERMAGAVERYQDVSKQNLGPQPLPTVGAGSNGTAGTSPAQAQ
jgi:hypothetical protein